MQFLREQRVIDYSLLVGVSRRPLDVAAQRAAWIAARAPALEALYDDFRNAAGARGLGTCFDRLDFETFCQVTCAVTRDEVGRFGPGAVSRDRLDVETFCQV